MDSESEDENSKEANLESDTNHKSIPDEETWFCDTSWRNINTLPHSCIPLFPKHLKKDYNTRINCELPYPIFDPLIAIDCDNYWLPFNSKLKKDTRLDYYRKLYSQSKTKPLIKDLKKNVITIPNYLKNLALGSLDTSIDEVWYYSGGILDCIEYNKSLYVANVVKPYSVHFREVSNDRTFLLFQVDKSSPIYSVKCNKHFRTPLIGIRQSRKVSIFPLFKEKENVTSMMCFEIRDCIFDMEFNYSSDQLSYVTSKHSASLIDLNTGEKISRHRFFPIRNNLSDQLAQVLFVDVNTMVFMNRCCIFLLDWRSRSFYALCLRNWLDCDELCTIAKKDDRTLYVTSTHNIMEINIQALKCCNEVMHMMTTPPFISSVTETAQGHYLSLLGSNVSDKVIVCNRKDLNIPQYVWNIHDSFRLTSTVRKLKHLDHLEERLSVPIMGMKLVKDPITNDVVMFTSNSVGDVFQQKIIRKQSDTTDTVNKLVDWIMKLSLKKRALEVTSIYNLNGAVHTITTHFPKEKNVNSFMNKDTAACFWKKYSNVIETDISSKVGETMNALWVDDKVTKESDAFTSQDKVMEWLHSTK
ncbi:hypothetical protein RI129_000495 [Pyrocoelia pectoralis]|uniref:Uncharacterized protein n=1 Tax=Pyrocoelia pectoralis TaxID=417401 RepID=A0AAN7VRJ4_9COLE